MCVCVVCLCVYTSTIVNYFNSNGVVLYDHVMDLRKALDEVVTVKGLTAEEKGQATSFVSTF